ncbi:hypothetical protein CANARDRAFT_21074 [[Candida] arabinofermentans NRRL YB-2248]|uniref:O-acyltransferase n=1 Tax=[Candida] arabinofermentans NRRL YB-2248 TaxID=983967 RepID=A0A1E4T5S0_9ASCO|nr:hypothetical protein CANARDRAFT_21074 [[Candida] arabinofermentans NRRL YB-2248]
MSQSSSNKYKSKIIENNKDNKRKSILLNTEYDDSVSNLNSTTPSTPSTPIISIPIPIKDNIRYKKDGSLRSKFGDFTFQPRESIFDKDVKWGSEFYGFFVAFWFCVFFSILKVILNYYIDNQSSSINDLKIVKLMYTDLLKVGMTDLLMYLTMYISVGLQLLIKYQYIEWFKTGLILQSLFELLFVFVFMQFANYMDFPWIAKIFLLLHSLVMLMKIHSYAFYNGYLWNIKKELEFSESLLKKDDTSIELQNSIEFCSFELNIQSNKSPFPQNITIWNFFMYSMYPTLVYIIDYPRTDKIRKKYLFIKLLGIFGVISLMIAISESHLYPIVMKCLELRESSLYNRITQYPLIIIEIIPPFLTVYLLVFYLIWELICNAIAELSYFADRDFYQYWWNSTDWNEYARDWNTIVHKFLLRHVYHSSISALQLNKFQATLVTFGLSSIVHELTMFVIYRKLRGYLLLLQMSQLPLIQLSKTKYMKDQKLLGNCIFWFGIVFGPSLMCTMYLVF